MVCVPAQGDKQGRKTVQAHGRQWAASLRAEGDASFMQWDCGEAGIDLENVLFER